ncbi:MAG TPA: S-layer homology domain-containing protein, partial [Clostridia bacterium]|nr:S-layer homology domain-containing protein [Clostridia bacterium]
YTFSSWTDGGSLSVTGSVYSFTMGTEDIHLTANFQVDSQSVTTGTITGTVTDGNNPVSEANVSLTVSGSVYSTTTIDGGSYSIGDVPAGTGYTVTASKWGYNNGSVSNVNVTANTTTSGVNIILTAIPPTTYTVTYYGNGNNGGSVPVDSNTYTQGASITVLGNTGNLVKSGYTFAGWNTATNGSGTSYAAGDILTMGIDNVRLYARWIENSSDNDDDDDDDSGSGSGSSGGTSGNSGANTQTSQSDTRKSETTSAGNTVTATTTAKATTDNSGKAAAAVTQSQLSDAVIQAVTEAAKQGEGTAARVEIKVEAPADASTVETGLPKAAVDQAAESKLEGLTVSTPVAAITFDEKALSTIAGEASGEVKITTSKVEASTLSPEVQQVVGDRPVFDFSVTSGDRIISQFGGNVEVSVPYTPKAGEDTSAIVIYLINAEGKPELVSNCAYDPATGMITFNTDHFSRYAVGYNKVTFKDVAANAWYGKAVSFVAARGITNGTGNGNYSPEAKMTRGQLLVMVMKAYGIAPDANQKDNFADSGSTYYTGYLAAAKRLGISGGVGGNMFAPEKEITRQEMFTLLYNALKAVSKLPQGNAGKSLSSFSDAGEIASWAKDAMTLMAQTGTVSGSGGKLSPANTTTRAEMAQVLYNLLSKR